MLNKLMETCQEWPILLQRKTFRLVKKAGLKTVDITEPLFKSTKKRAGTNRLFQHGAV